MKLNLNSLLLRAMSSSLLKSTLMIGLAVGLMVTFSFSRPSKAQRFLSELPLGSVVHSVLSPDQMKNLVGDSWVLMDNRSIVGSALDKFTGLSQLPDARGMYLRGKNNGRSDGWKNPDGELAIGELQGDQLRSHAHNQGWPTCNANESDGNKGGIPLHGNNCWYEATNHPTDPSGGNETRPKSLTLNIYIKINE
jgi:hypothetical protein